ncbi:hypothetical protein ACLKA7_015661 [Drosophila subpalustris]
MTDAKSTRSKYVISRKSSKLGPILPAKLEQIVEQRRELWKEQRSESRGVRQKGILIERGIRKCSSDRNLKLRAGEFIGDCQLNSNRRREELVQQTRDEFSDELRLDAKYASLKGILMEKGIRTHSDKLPKAYSIEKNEDIFRNVVSPVIEELREQYVQQLSSNIKPAYLKERVLEKGFIEVCEIEGRNMETTEDFSIDMAKIINDINQFTANLESNAHCIDWQEFRLNLLKIHGYYMNNMQKKDPQNVTQSNDGEDDEEIDIDLAQVELNIENVMEPLNTLITRSKTLGNHIEGVQHKINSLDLKVEEFYRKYNQTLLNREKAFNDMMTLQSMREKIGQRLSQVEMEIHASHTQLLQRGVQNK